MKHTVTERNAASAPAETADPRHPLGLPAGSVRALLTLLVVGYIIGQTWRGLPLRLLWTETLMIVLAHYFTSRRFVQLSPELRETLEADGRIEPEENPLYLPKHSVRTLIVGGFLLLAIQLARQNRLLEPQAAAILGTVGAYFLGILFRLGSTAIFGEARPPNWWVDGKALFTILVVGGTIVVHAGGWAGHLPFDAKHLENLTMGLVLFYFGSR